MGRTYDLNTQHIVEVLTHTFHDMLYTHDIAYVGLLVSADPASLVLGKLLEKSKIDMVKLTSIIFEHDSKSEIDTGDTTDFVAREKIVKSLGFDVATLPDIYEEYQHPKTSKEKMQEMKEKINPESDSKKSTVIDTFINIMKWRRNIRNAYLGYHVRYLSHNYLFMDPTDMIMCSIFQINGVHERYSIAYPFCDLYHPEIIEIGKYLGISEDLLNFRPHNTELFKLLDKTNTDYDTIIPVFRNMAESEFVNVVIRNSIPLDNFREDFYMPASDIYTFDE